MLVIEHVTLGADLDGLVAGINGARWDESNDLAPFDVTDLAAYLTHPDHVLIACREVAGADARLVGIASARLCMKPYQRSRWLHVDEVDVAADARRRGVGRAMMEALFEVAEAAGCHEVWLGTEPHNVAANALYGSLDPTGREPFVGYTWSIQGG